MAFSSTFSVFGSAAETTPSMLSAMMVALVVLAGRKSRGGRVR
jgi:hypothetical protein